MKRRIPTSVLTLLLALTSGCGASFSGGSEPDSGPPGDSGTKDTGPADTGTHTDSGPAPDGGGPGPDGGGPGPDGGGPGASCLSNSGVCQADGTPCNGIDAGQTTCATGLYCCEGEGVPPPDSGPPPSGPCPPSPPAGLCTSPNVQCEYGTSPNINCNQVYTCTGGSWLTMMGGTCPAPSCPASYGLVMQGTSCSPDGGVCAYPKGTCTCSEGSPPTVGGPIWECFAAQPGCLDFRPDLGTPCSAPSSLTCDYGACAGGIAVSCQSGTWQEAYTVCAG
jgi:hypothetical protein